MSVNNSLLFIDTNKYLDLYRLPSKESKKLLGALREQAEYIFITQQVVSEVQRNKINEAAKFLQDICKERNIPGFGLPDHLSTNYTTQQQGIHQQKENIKKKIDEMNIEVGVWGLNIMKEISHSEDEVSKALSPIFANAVSHSRKELQKARERKELGNPPGKNNSIGDQLNWEQILTHFQGKKRLWIISKDPDYGTTYAGKGFLNCFLYNELCTVASEPEVSLFVDLVNGIQDFVDKTGVKVEQPLTSEEVEEIERAENLLPPLTQLPNNLFRMLENLQSQEEEQRRKFFGSIQSLENIQSLEEERRRKFFGNIQSLEEERQRKLFGNIESQQEERQRKLLGNIEPQENSNARLSGI